jgi:hypothetical protein
MKGRLLATYATLNQKCAYLLDLPDGAPGPLRTTLQGYQVETISEIRDRKTAGQKIVAVYNSLGDTDLRRHELWERVVSIEHVAERWKPAGIKTILMSLMPAISQELVERWTRRLMNKLQSLQSGAQNEALLVNVAGNKGCQKSTGMPCALHLITMGCYPHNHDNADLELTMREHMGQECKDAIDRVLADCRTDQQTSMIYVSVLRAVYCIAVLTFLCCCLSHRCMAMAPTVQVFLPP